VHTGWGRGDQKESIPGNGDSATKEGRERAGLVFVGEPGRQKVCKGAGQVAGDGKRLDLWGGPAGAAGGGFDDGGEEG